MRHYPHLRISVRGPGPSGTSTHLTRQLPGTHYVEICRRVRLTENGGRLQARAGGSKAARITPIPGGVTGDPWAPVVVDKDGSEKVLTVDASGFGYRRM